MLREYPTWHFYSSSLLITYDAAADIPNIRLKMIDFTHAFPINKKKGLDHEYLYGLAFLRKCLIKILQKNSKVDSCA